jgi:predicted amidophosphoribosyltransferase
VSHPVRNVRGVLLPTRCPVCGETSRGAPCRRCLVRLRRAPEAPPPDGLTVCRSLLAYDGAGRRLVTGLKYRNDRAALTWLAGRMAELLVPPAGAVVAWPPTSAARRRRRGFDQAELLARAVARRWGLPCRPLLVREGRGDAQTGASAVARAAGPALRAASEAAVGRTAVAGRTVVVVDDVTTTGATLRSAAGALRAAGAAQVMGVTAARTPRRLGVPTQRLDTGTDRAGTA